MLDYHEHAHIFEELIEADEELQYWVSDILVHETHFSYRYDGWLICQVYWDGDQWIDRIGASEERVLGEDEIGAHGEIAHRTIEDMVERLRRAALGMDIAA